MYGLRTTTVVPVALNNMLALTGGFSEKPKLYWRNVLSDSDDLSFIDLLQIIQPGSGIFIMDIVIQEIHWFCSSFVVLA